MIFKQYTLNGKRRVSNGKRHVIQRKQTRENVCGLCLNSMQIAVRILANQKTALVIPLIVSVRYLEILRFLSVIEMYIKMSEILFFFAFSVNLTDGSISGIHTCVNVYKFCQYGAFFTKCTIM